MDSTYELYQRVKEIDEAIKTLVGEKDALIKSLDDKTKELIKKHSNYVKKKCYSVHLSPQNIWHIKYKCYNPKTGKSTSKTYSLRVRNTECTYEEACEMANEVMNQIGPKYSCKTDYVNDRAESLLACKLMIKDLKEAIR